jgi:dihydrodipicolinate synthase/N-acetylneuraminate lyase
LLDWYDDIVNERWQQARQRQARLHAFSRATAILRGSGNLHAIVGKAVAAASPFLEPIYHTRRPYLPVPRETIAQFQRLVAEQFPDLLWRP